MAWTDRQRHAYNLYLQEARQYARANEVKFNVARSDPEFKFWRNVLREQERRVRDDKDVDRSPHGDYAQSLVRLGYRNQSAWWNVGETPKVRKRIREVVRR